ncbi:small GTPase superfamily, ARF type [Kipferlia bialata]|uniref:Small GTPase superfamily, ARF type n=1 Tax=Kipferlia bialata TaxID=797122 RepID=A0A9K3GGU1_9EUKA|nr:small GTPase superfamily, ARF type [Kipferlia bialata]|eukprot:g2974.t1
MGSAVYRMKVNAIFDRDTDLLMLGLDNAGVSTVLCRMATILGGDIDYIHTIGLSEVETLTCHKLRVTSYDPDSSDRVASRWKREQNSRDKSALIFVVDSSDYENGWIERARGILLQYMSEPAFKGSPLLVLANKQDIPGAMTVAHVTEHLCLRDIEADWHVASTVANAANIRNTGIHEGLKWLGTHLRQS